MSIRVHELAKEFKLSTAALKKHLGDLGVVVKSHMSPVDGEIVKKLRSRFNEEMSAVKKRQQNRNILYNKIVLKNIKKKIIRDLIAIYNYPPQRIIPEPEIKFGKKILLPDIVVYEDNELEKALLVIEIKQYLIPELQERTKQQILQYGTILNAKYAIVILPTYKFAYCIKNNKLCEIEEIPIYDEETGFKELTPEELHKLKLILKKQLKSFPLFALPSLIIPILPLILLAYSKNIVSTLKKDKYVITGDDFLEEHKEIILTLEIKDFIIFVKNHFNLEDNEELNNFLKQHKNYTEKNEIIIINDKIKILEQAQRLIYDEKVFHSQDFIKFLYENWKNKILKKEEEIAQKEIEHEQEKNKLKTRIFQAMSHTIGSFVWSDKVIIKKITV